MKKNRGKLKAAQRCAQRQTLQEMRDLFGPWLSVPKNFAQGAYVRLFPPSRTFWLFLSQVLNGASCRHANRTFLAWLASEKKESASPNTAAYCKARQRLPIDEIERMHEEVARKVQAGAGTKTLWHARRVKVVDGSSVSMPDTAENQGKYPQPKGQSEGCGFPVMRIVALFSLGTGVLLEVAKDQLKVHERTLFRRLWDRFERGDIVLGDRGFCGFANFVELTARGVDSVMRKHQRLSKGLTTRKRLGKNDRLVFWRKTTVRPTWLSKEHWAGMPEKITVREITVHIETPGFRTDTIVILTTLLDHKALPASAFTELYRQRWAVELYLRDIKTTLGMDILRCKTPDMVEKELWMHLILYNLIRALICDAATAYALDPQRLSFKGSIDTLRIWAPLLSQATPTKRTQLYEQMRHYIATDPIPNRPNRKEPRAKKRRPKNYPLLTSPRADYKEIPHRNQYKKTKS